MDWLSSFVQQLINFVLSFLRPKPSLPASEAEPKLPSESLNSGSELPPPPTSGATAPDEPVQEAVFPDSLNWGRKDYESLIRCSAKGLYRPEHWLLLACRESGLNPKAQSHYAPARGLWQALPNVLQNLGYSKPENFTKEPPSVQIEYALRYLEEWRKRYKFQEWKLPGDLYLCNFTPANLPYKDIPAHIIYSYDKDPEFYWVNRGLDRRQNGHPVRTLEPPRPAKKPDKYKKDPTYQGKGYINVADMSLALLPMSSTWQYKQAVRSLNKLLQEGLNAQKLGPRLKVDGEVGSKTNQILQAFWEKAGFPQELRELDGHTREALLT